MKMLNNATEFVWYKKTLDVNRRYEHKHENEPKQFPCKAHSRLDNVSDYSSSRSATDIYYHDFIYKEETICSKCGHKTTEWPSEQVDTFCEDT